MTLACTLCTTRLRMPCSSSESKRGCHTQKTAHKRAGKRERVTGSHTRKAVRGNGSVSRSYAASRYSRKSTHIRCMYVYIYCPINRRIHTHIYICDIYIDNRYMIRRTCSLTRLPATHSTHNGTSTPPNTNSSTSTMPTDIAPQHSTQTSARQPLLCDFREALLCCD